MVMRDGRVRDSVVFSIVGPDWLRVKAGLQEKMQHAARPPSSFHKPAKPASGQRPGKPAPALFGNPRLKEQAFSRPNTLRGGGFPNRLFCFAWQRVLPAARARRGCAALAYTLP
jgi:hypothetical protein